MKTGGHKGILCVYLLSLPVRGAWIEINNTTEIKNEVSEMRKEINSHDNRIIKVEESVKSAHHRIDGIETRLNDEKEV